MAVEDLPRAEEKELSVTSLDVCKELLLIRFLFGLAASLQVYAPTSSALGEIVLEMPILGLESTIRLGELKSAEIL
ncbi:hypothetical protein IQ216_00815 [Cyanobium sp. LEGE 06143]|uniref:hypothetical protein n=1 Tax=Cyanobium sp. LEGE 06143 TaxID=945727 RepID=UPI00187F94D9|nr:hypothetical protein [Cyanobium sp. LEGE 06143]MBE9171678.1 hypothetical protein [Cyanobium sp. LEGE 06143]